MAANDKIYRFDEIKIIFPKCAERLKNYIMQLLTEKGIPDDSVEEMTNNILNHSMDSSNRLLYDFFDKYELYIVVDCMEFMRGDDWMASVRNKFLECKNTRVEAETLAFNEAFVLLEQEKN